ncbi:MAG: hypothetical protein IBX44_07385 [Sulfurospirillum sp.]|nr:hypothetical protein [Sulfurospirillum sp.]
MEVVLIVDIENLGDKQVFEKHLFEEGFVSVANEPFAYHGTTSTSLLSTETFILQVLKEALELAGFSTCKAIFQVGENGLKTYSVISEHNV